MIGLLLFEDAVTPAEAERALVAFLCDFNDSMGSCLDAYCVDADTCDGVHCHVLWAGHSMSRAMEAEVNRLWSHGTVLLTHVRSSDGDDAEDMRAWGRVVKGAV